MSSKTLREDLAAAHRRAGHHIGEASRRWRRFALRRPVLAGLAMPALNLAFDVAAVAGSTLVAVSELHRPWWWGTVAAFGILYVGGAVEAFGVSITRRRIAAKLHAYGHRAVTRYERTRRPAQPEDI